MTFKSAVIWAQRATTGASAKPPMHSDTTPLGQALQEFGSAATRVYRTADSHIVVLPAQPGQAPGLSHELARHDLHELLTSAPAQARGISSLPFLLREAYQSENRQGVALSLELRDSAPDPRRSLADLVIDALAWVDFPLERIRFSSTSIKQLQRLQEVAPTAALALMTAPTQGGPAEAQPFTADTVKQARDVLGYSLVAVHPELHTLARAPMTAVREAMLELGTWVHQERNPLTANEQCVATWRALALSREHSVPLVMATAYPAQTRALLHQP